MIEVTGLTKSFGDIKALVDVSFKVEKGQIVGFLGANGAGKTTTMDIICGCTGADQGTAKIADFDITEQPLEAKRRLGYLPEIPPLHNEMRVCDFIRFAAELHNVPSIEISKRIVTTIEKLSLGDVQKRIIGNLSKGYRQRVGLAQAIVHEPEVLVLDEPTEGLDPNQIAQIRGLIRDLAGDHTIILSSHILSEVQNTCDHVIIIHKGSIVEQGTYDDINKRLQTGHLYRLRVGRDALTLAQKLSSIQELSNIQTTPRQVDLIEFSLKSSADETVLDEVSKMAITGGYGLRELTLKMKSLEEVFFQLTK